MTATVPDTRTVSAAAPSATQPPAMAGAALSYDHGAATTALLGDTIGRNLDRAVAAFPDREALVDVQYATARIGAIMVNINPAYRAHELAYVLRQAGISVLCASLRHKSSDYRVLVEEVRRDCPGLTSVHYIEDPTWDELLSAADAVPPGRLAAREAQLSCDDPVNIQYTSGTTGFPKGATLSHHNILNNGYFVGELLDYTERDRICIPVPFYHCFGMVMGNLAATSHGACMVIPARSFDPQATLRAVAEERCTSLYGVPTMFIAELNLPDFSSYDLGSLRTGIMAGSPCPEEVMRRVVTEMNMAQVSICYGMTETSPVATQTRHDDDLERRTGTVGRVLPHVEVKIVDSVTGVVLPRGRAGELCTRGYGVMLGYWADPERTAEAVDSGRWMHTGDLAVMRPDGYVRIVGRMKDMIIRGGENVYPREIEEFLHGHPKISDVQVVGVPDRTYGEEILACVIPLDPADPPTIDDITAYCRERLAHYKVPRRLEVMDAFPMTVSGKVRKVELRERYALE
jgi:fatty-acyl-CoA synthase